MFLFCGKSVEVELALSLHCADRQRPLHLDLYQFDLKIVSFSVYINRHTFQFDEDLLFHFKFIQ